MGTRAAVSRIEVAGDIVDTSGYPGQFYISYYSNSHLLRAHYAVPDVIEQFVVGLHDFFRDKGRVGALNGREEVCRRLHDLSRSATKSMQYAPSHPYMLGLKGSEVSVRSDYKGRGHLREDSAFSRIIP